MKQDKNYSWIQIDVPCYASRVDFVDYEVTDQRYALLRDIPNLDEELEFRKLHRHLSPDLVPKKKFKVNFKLKYIPLVDEPEFIDRILGIRKIVGRHPKVNIPEEFERILEGDILPIEEIVKSDKIIYEKKGKHSSKVRRLDPFIDTIIEYKSHRDIGKKGTDYIHFFAKDLAEREEVFRDMLMKKVGYILRTIPGYFDINQYRRHSYFGLNTQSLINCTIPLSIMLEGPQARGLTASIESFKKEKYPKNCLRKNKELGSSLENYNPTNKSQVMALEYAEKFLQEYASGLKKILFLQGDTKARTSHIIEGIRSEVALRELGYLSSIYENYENKSQEKVRQITKVSEYRATGQIKPSTMIISSSLDPLKYFQLGYKNQLSDGKVRAQRLYSQLEGIMDVVKIEG